MTWLILKVVRNVIYNLQYLLVRIECTCGNKIKYVNYRIYNVLKLHIRMGE